MPGKLSEPLWQMLMERIRAHECTPFLGAGACVPPLQLGGDIASQWATQYNYPFRESSRDLLQVAQFIAVTVDGPFPKQEMLRLLQNKQPDFTAPDEPHAVLADLPLPIYVTTNYDDFMVRALRAKGKEPKRELCRWNDSILYDSVFASIDGFTPKPETPVVFHLHGHNENLDSIVLTEDDYVEFMVHISQDSGLLPQPIQAALTDTSLVFIGYSLADWDFRVLYRELVTSRSTGRRYLSILVQPPPKSNDAGIAEQVQDYLDTYFKSKGIRVYWGTAVEFAADLRQHWEDYKNRNGIS